MLLDHNYNACLTDFGCASLVGELPEGFTYLKVSTVRPGTLRWAAPEHFSLNEEETKNTIKSDIYSFGNMALLVRTGQLSLEYNRDPLVRYCPDNTRGPKSEPMPPSCYVCIRVTSLVGRSRDRSTISIGHSSNGAGHRFRRDRMPKTWCLRSSNF